MSNVYGPYNSSSTPALQNGQVTRLQVAQRTGHVTLANKSITDDMLIDFGQSQPPAVTQAGGASWSYVLYPGDVLDLDISSSDQILSPQGSYWTGNIWVLPIDQSASLSLTGQLPTIGNLWITTFDLGELVPARATAAPTVSQTGQQRVVAVPVSPFINATEMTSVVAPSDIILNTTSLSARNISDNAVTAFLYALSVSIQIPATGNVSASFQLICDIVTGGSVVVVSTIVLRETVFATSGAIKQFQWLPAVPGAIFLSGFAGGGGVTLRFRLHITAASATTLASLDCIIESGLNTVSSLTAGSIGSYIPNQGVF